MSNDDTNGESPTRESAQIAAAGTRADRAEPASFDGASAGENSESSSSPWGVTAIALVGVAALVIAVFGLRETASILMPAFLAVNLVIAGMPLQRLLAKFMPGVLASIGLLLVLYALLAAFVASLVWSVWVAAEEIPRYQDRFTQLYDDTIMWLGDFGLSEDQIRESLGNVQPDQIVGYVQTAAGSLSSLGTMLAILVVAIFFLCFDIPGLGTRWDRVTAMRPRVAESLEEFSHGIRRYWIVSTAFGLVVAAMDWVALIILGVPLAGVWAVLAFITNYIPNIGFVLGLVPPALFALLIGGPSTALWVVVIYSVINLVMQSFIQPKFTGDAVGLTPTMTFLSLAFWSLVAGALGAILAVPLTLAFKALFIDTDPRMGWFSTFMVSTGSEKKRERRREKRHTRRAARRS